MPNIPTGYGQCALPFQHALLSRTAYVVFGFDNNAALVSPATAAQEIVDAFDSAAMEAQVDASVAVGPALVTLNVGGEVLSGAGPNFIQGTFSGNEVPPHTALLVNKVTLTGGRRGRGRMFVPWFIPDEAVNGAGQIDSTSLSVRQTALDAFLAALATADLPMVLLHNDEGLPSPVTDLVAQSLIGIQRRRLGRD